MVQEYEMYDIAEVMKFRGGAEPPIELVVLNKACNLRFQPCAVGVGIHILS